MTKVLIIEDEPDIATAMRMLLDDEYKVEVALGGRLGLQRLAKTDADVLLLDINMPEVSGRDILDYMRKSGVKVPVIVVTAVACANSVRNELENKYRIDGFVSKTYLAEELQSEVKRVLSKRK
ncbi:Regulator of RpoS [uncultured archaeon]|nr:Regulator of RpoS [uncultured archaeon]